MFGFEKLLVYNKGRRLVREVYDLQKKFPVEERYGLGDQIRRSIVSVTSNIAEGAGRDSYKEKAHFLSISFGSLLEAFSQIQNAQDLGYLSEQDVDSIRPLFEEVSKMISGLKNKYEEKTTA